MRSWKEVTFLTLTILGGAIGAEKPPQMIISGRASVSQAALIESPTPTFTHTPTATATATATETFVPTPTATNTPRPRPTKTLAPTLTPKPTLTPVEQIKKIDNNTSAHISLQPGQSITLQYQVFSGDTLLIFSPTNGVRLPNANMEVRSPERLADQQNGGNQKPIGTGNDCPKALQSSHGECTVNKSGHWSNEPAKNIWEVKIIAPDNQPVEGNLSLSNASGSAGKAGCYSYREDLPNGLKDVLWTHCPGASG